jgi:integrase
MGTGSLYRRKSDGRWVAAISVGPRGNTTRLVRYAKTRREAVDELDELRKLARPTAGSARTTVGAYLRSWLDVAGRRSLKASTWRTYDVALRLHIEPAIGHIPLARLTAEHVDHMLAASTLEPKGQRNVLGFLGRVLDVALARGYVLRNAARLVEPPRGGGAEAPALSIADARRIREAVRKDRLEALWLLALASGLRQGELLGLRWEDVDLDVGTLTVQYALTRVEGKYVLDDPKTARSRRTLALPTWAVTVLRDHRRRQLEERVAAGRGTEDGLVFVTAPGHPSKADPEGIGGRPLNGGWVSHRWRAIADGLGLSVTFHGLRHANATIMTDRGVPEHVRMARLGHTTKQMARHYGHATDAPDREAARVLEEALG